MVHPGRILLEDYLAPRGISVWHLAKDIGVPRAAHLRDRPGTTSDQQPTSPTDLRITSACRSATGSTCRRGMTGSEKQNCRKRLAEDNR